MRPAGAAGLAVLAFAVFLLIGSLPGGSSSPDPADGEAVAATPEPTPASGAKQLLSFGSAAPVPRVWSMPPRRRRRG